MLNATMLHSADDNYPPSASLGRLMWCTRLLVSIHIFDSASEAQAVESKLLPVIMIDFIAFTMGRLDPRDWIWKLAKLR